MSISGYIVGITNEFRIVKNLARNALDVAKERAQLLGDINKLAEFIIDYPVHGKWDKLFETARRIEELSKLE